MTKLARRQLVQPDYLTRPAGMVETYGPAVADLCADAGFAPDPQQELALDLIFAIRADGLSAAFSFAVICCRQNLKTGLFKQASIGWLYVTDQRLIVWSAHEMATTRDALRDLEELITGSPALSKLLPATSNNGIYDAHGQERIELTTGQRIKFKARTFSGGRGLTGDKVILDEAFALVPSHMGSLLPTMMARPDPQVLYGSSAGKADSVVLRDVRDRGRAGSTERMGYLEWLAPRKPCATKDCTHPKPGTPGWAPGCALDDVELRVKGNPTLTTGRITLETIEGMRHELPPEEFARECLGWWDEPDAAGEDRLAHAKWLELADPDAEPASPVAFGFDVMTDRTAYIAVAWRRPDGHAQTQLVEVIDEELADGTVVTHDVAPTTAGRLVAHCKRLVDKWGGVVVAPKAFEDDLTKAGVANEVLAAATFPAATGELVDAIDAGEVHHGNQPLLNDSVKAARLRSVGSANDVAIQLRDAPEVGPVAAVARALYGLEHFSVDVWGFFE